VCQSLAIISSMEDAGNGLTAVLHTSVHQNVDFGHPHHWP